MFLLLPVDVKAYIRDLLLRCFAEETEGTVRHKIGDAIAEIARQQADAGRSYLQPMISTHGILNFLKRSRGASS